ncbi:MAG: hypothetical protein JWM19_4966 [Actinomycetia bacterium]|nr:hypothetical protein [Actinomycetes bacterium]
MTYDDLVTAATLGLSRRPLPVAALSGLEALSTPQIQGVIAQDDAADALLDAAALHVAARRAGMVPLRGVAVAPPMAPDLAPELPPGAARMLRQAAGDAELLADLLVATAEAGFRAPAPLLPALLTAAVRTVALRPAVNATLGSRGRWLAAHRADWRRVTDQADASPAGAASDALLADPRTWETGGRAERLAYLTALRGHDLVVARELLAAGWSRENAEERAQLLAALGHGLSLADEEFLEAALDDRAAGVRAAAQDLLARLPESAFRQRAAARATVLLGLKTAGTRQWLEVSLPDDAPGPELARDGISSSPPGAGIGAGAWLLTQLIAAAPLGEWVRRFGMSAREVVSLEIRPGPGLADGAATRKDSAATSRSATAGLTVEVHAGWRLAAVRQGDPQWAAALLSGDGPLLAPGRPQAAWAGTHELAALLAPATRASLATAVFPRLTRAASGMDGAKAGSRAPMTAITELTAWPGPWPEAVADYVLAMVTASLSAQGAVRALQGLVASTARHIPVTGPRDYAAELIRLSNTPDCAYPWIAVLRRSADTLALRRAFQAALTETSPAHDQPRAVEP